MRAIANGPQPVAAEFNAKTTKAHDGHDGKSKTRLCDSSVPLLSFVIFVIFVILVIPVLSGLQWWRR
jgi:hypothetical protein